MSFFPLNLVGKAKESEIKLLGDEFEQLEGGDTFLC